MDHAEIESAGVRERWVNGTLPEPESARFEEHLVGCASCQEVVETTQALRASLRTLAGREAGPRRWPWVLATLATAAAVVLAAGALFVARDATRERDEARRIAGEAQRRVPERAPAALPAALPVLLFETVRGEGAAVVFRIPRGAPSVVFDVEVPQGPAAFTAALFRKDGARVFVSGPLRPATPGLLAFALPASLLSAGVHRLEVTAVGGTATPLRFPFRVVPE